MKSFISAIVIFLAFSTSIFAMTLQNPIQFGGQFRVRFESADPISFAQPSEQTTSDMLLFRTRVWGKSDISEKNLNVFFEIQDSRISGSEASVAANSANLDLHQGYIDILSLFGKNANLRLGRQKLKYGDQRLISTLEWSNVARAWDGARLEFLLDPLKIDFFYTVITEVADTFQDQTFSGIYSTFNSERSPEIDFYLLSKHSGQDDTVNTAGPSLNLDQYTTGTRLKGQSGPIDYSGEIVKQFGKMSGMDIDAHAYAVTAGVKLPVKVKSRVGVAYDFASGDENPGDNEIGTFDPLFPFGHYYQGHADVFSWKNGSDLQGHVMVAPTKDTKIMLAFHHFQLDESRDSWYGASGAAIGTDASGASGDDIGQEIDIHVKTVFRDIIKLWFGYARFIGGDYVERNFSIHDKDFFFCQGTINFN